MQLLITTYSSYALRAAWLMFFLFLFAFPAMAQETPEERKKREEDQQKNTEQLRQTNPDDTLLGWTRAGQLTLNFGQVALSNWAQGGESSFSLLGLANYNADFKSETKFWYNRFDATYGMLKAGTEPLLKSDDRFDLLSKAGTKAFGDFYYAGLLNFTTQFTPTFTEGVYTSSFLSPATLIAALGLDYTPNPLFSFFVSPFTGKFTYVSDDELAAKGAFGVPNGQHLRREFGAYIALLMQRDLMENINFQTKLKLFNNYTDPIAVNRKNVDINWETMFTFKVNKFFQAMLSTNLIYDHDTPIGIDLDGDKVADTEGPRTQFKETFGLGISLKL
ncbi:MAG: DUF3078 domain-containing protein [Bacteroidota bacterium]|nr:DUF3078 domain-containing protein [Bacteroidota bacterium]